MKIPEKLLDVLNKQVTAEHRAALIYTQFSYDLDRLSFPGMSTWMAAQADEERVHANKIARHIIDRGGRVSLGKLESPGLKADTPLDAFRLALDHERSVSEMIRNLVRTAEKLQDYDSRTLLNWFLDEQIEEESTVGEIVDQLKLVGEDGSGLLRIDARLGAERTPATPMTPPSV